MTAGEIQAQLPLLGKLIGELERRGAGTPAEIARRLGADWTEDRVLAVLAELFSGGVVGHDHDVGFWWVA